MNRIDMIVNERLATMHPGQPPLTQCVQPQRAVGYYAPTPFEPTPAQMFWGIASTASAAACAYHGYKRNQSVGWALGWALFGAMLPVIAPAIAVAEGFGEKKRG